MNRVLHFNLIKKLFLGVFILMNLVGCSNDEDSFEPKLFLEAETLSVANTSSNHSIDFVTNQAWRVESNVEWITFETESGEKGKSSLAFTVLENDDDERTGIVSIWAGDNLKKEIQVTQEAGNRDDIYVKVNGTGEGFSWDDATSLDQAMALAVSGNTIHIAEGTYTPTTTVTGGDASDNGDITFEISKYVRLKGGYPANATKGTEANHKQYKTILSGGGTSYHVVTVSAPKNEGQKVILEGLTITGGKAGVSTTAATINGTGFRRDYGGGVTIGNAIVDIIDTEIVDNKSDKNVSGLYAFEGSIVTMHRSKVSRNISAGNAGGVWISESTAYFFDSEFNENEGGTAAGVHGYPEAKLYMYNCVIADNRGKSYGAAFYIRQNSMGVLVNCQISGNTSTSKNGGGGVMLYGTADVSIISSTITQNTIAGPGGGVYRRSGVNTVNIYNSIISGNKQANDGPDVDVYETNAPAAVIKSSVIGDVAYDQNGGVITGATFNASTMLSKVGNHIFLPVGQANPALDHGMTVTELINLGNSFDPKVPEDIISADLLRNSRAGLRIMGAYVKGN